MLIILIDIHTNPRPSVAKHVLQPIAEQPKTLCRNEVGQQFQCKRRNNSTGRTSTNYIIKTNHNNETKKKTDRATSIEKAIADSIISMRPSATFRYIRINLLHMRCVSSMKQVLEVPNRCLEERVLPRL